MDLSPVPSYLSSSSSAAKAANSSNFFDQSLMAQLFPAENEHETVFDQLDSGTQKDRTVDIDTSGMMRSANNVVTDAPDLAAKRENGKVEVHEKMSEMKQDWDQAKKEAIECLKEAATNQGIDPEHAVSQMVPNEHEKGKGAAAGVVVADAATAGLGSFITASSKVGFVAMEVGNDRKDLNLEQKRALIEEATRIAQSGGAQDTRMKEGGTVASSSERAPKKDGEWGIHNLDEHGMEGLLTQRLEDQPEFAELADVAQGLEDVTANHRFVADNYGKSNLIPKAQNMVTDNILTAQLKEAETPVDFSSVQIAAASMQGMARDTSGFDTSIQSANERFFSQNVSEISTKIDTAKINTPDMAARVSANMTAQLKVG